jgi:hypothetical protein
MKLLLYMKPCLGRECGGESRTLEVVIYSFADGDMKMN